MSSFGWRQRLCQTDHLADVISPYLRLSRSVCNLTCKTCCIESYTKDPNPVNIHALFICGACTLYDVRTKTLIASVVVLVLGPEAHPQTIGVQSVTTSTATSGKGSISSSIASGYYAGIASTGLASGTNGGGESAVWQGYWQFTFQLSGYAGSPASAPSVNCTGYTRFEGTSASTSAGGAPGFGSSSASAWADCGSYATNATRPCSRRPLARTMITTLIRRRSRSQ